MLDVLSYIVATLVLLAGLGVGINWALADQHDPYTSVVCHKPDVIQRNWGDAWVSCVFSQISD